MKFEIKEYVSERFWTESGKLQKLGTYCQCCDPILWVLIPPITLPMIPTYFKELYFAIRFNQVPSC